MKDIKEIKLAFLGSGFMAQAMIRGIINAGTLPAEHVYAVNPVDPDTCVMLSEKYGIVAAMPGDARGCGCHILRNKAADVPRSV